MNGSGKVLKIWSYDCKEEGQQLAKKKNESQICKWEETDKDFLIKVTETFNKKGEVVKNVSKYTLSDTAIVEWTTYDSDGNIQNHQTFDKDYNVPLLQEYYQKGKIYSKREYIYQENKLVTIKYLKKGVFMNETRYQYEKDRLVETHSINKKNEVSKTVRFSYS